MKKLLLVSSLLFVLAGCGHKEEEIVNEVEMENEEVSTEKEEIKKEVPVKKEVVKEEIEKDYKNDVVNEKESKVEDFSSELRSGVIYFGGVEVKGANLDFEVLYKETSYGVGSNSKYAVDSKNVYERYCLDSEKGSKCFVEIMIGVKPEDFITLENYYAKDHKNVYFSNLNQKSEVIIGAEPWTFGTIGYNGYAKDKTNCYYMGKKVEMTVCDNL